MDSIQPLFFDHEKLEVYRKALAFIAWLTPILEDLLKAGDVKEQVDRASTSIPLNMAEGNGKFSMKDRCRYFDTANGSALACRAGLNVLVAKGKLTAEQIRPGKELLQGIVRMLYGLLKSLSDRNYERGV